MVNTLISGVDLILLRTDSKTFVKSETVRTKLF